MNQPTSDPRTWVPVAPNTATAAASALRTAADRYRQRGFSRDADACIEIADRLSRAVEKWNRAPLPLAPWDGPDAPGRGVLTISIPVDPHGDPEALAERIGAVLDAAQLPGLPVTLDVRTEGAP